MGERKREAKIEAERERERERERPSSSGGSPSQKIAATSFARLFVRYLDLFHAITAIRGCFNNRPLIVTTEPPPRSSSKILALVFHVAILSLINDAWTMFRRIRACVAADGDVLREVFHFMVEFFRGDSWISHESL